MYLKDLSKIIFNPLRKKGINPEDAASMQIKVCHHILDHEMFKGSISQFKEYCDRYRNNEPVVVEIVVDKGDNRNISDSIKNKIIRIL